MEEAKRRKEEQRLKAQMEEERKWKEIQAYNPWGKPGAGAPSVRDKKGKKQNQKTTKMKQIDDKKKKKKKKRKK
jgi:hypothetical protein